MSKGTLDTISSVVWFALAAAVCYGASVLGLGSAGAPGSGFILFWSGVILAILSLVVLAGSRRAARETRHDLDTIRWPRVLAVLAGLVLYGLLLERLGFIPTTFLLLIFLLAMSDEADWRAVLAVAGGGAFVSFALFDRWLNIRLPRGFFGF